MGNLLGSPITTKETHHGTLNSYPYGISSMQGWRIHMEDAHIAQPLPDLPDHSLFAVLDGHGGSFSAEFSSTLLFDAITSRDAWKEYCQRWRTTEGRDPELMGLLQRALSEAFCYTDARLHVAMRKEDSQDSGTTVVVVMITPTYIVCANAGDSRAVYSRCGVAVPLSFDHKPDDPAEERRIRDRGGYVSAGRVEGDLAVSRGLGDFRFKEDEVVMSGAGAEAENKVVVDDDDDGKEEDDDGTNDRVLMTPGDQKVSPVPDIIIQNRAVEEDEFVVIACDGIWDVQTNQECVKMVADIFAEGESDVGLICEEVLDLCLIKGSKDNMTVIIIKFPKQAIGTGGGVAARRERRGVFDNGGKYSPEGQTRSPTPNPYIPRSDQEDCGEEQPI